MSHDDSAIYQDFVVSKLFDMTAEEGPYTFVDWPSEAGSYTYWLVSVDSGGNFEIHDPVTVNLPHFLTTFLPIVSNN